MRVMDDGWGEAGPALSPAQRRLWATDGRAPDRSSWTASVVLRCSGPLDVEAVRRAVVATVQRQEGWGSEVAWSFVDHAATAAPERQAEVLRRAQEEVRPFAISGEPLVRALVQRVGEEDHRVVLTVARLVADPALVHRVVLPELARLVQGTP
ncbi:MAG TPA: hypothetical protein VMB72_01025, partial [Acidimicrobiales bacterium]|nr:hypothetical protein [Acidimicrobiales bacterium]